MPDIKNDDELFSLNTRRIVAMENDLINELKAFSRANKGEPISRAAYKKWALKRFSGDTIVRKFGSWESACEKAGVAYIKKHTYSDNELIVHFEKVWRWRGQPLVRNDLIEYNKSNGTTVHPDVYVRRWGTFKTIVKLFSQYKLGQISFEQLIDSKKIENKREEISPALRAEILRRDNYTCQDCGVSPRKGHDVSLHIHHIIPVSHGGKSTLDNLITNCSTCNLGKSDRVLSD